MSEVTMLKSGGSESAIVRRAPTGVIGVVLSILGLLLGLISPGCGPPS